MPDPIALDLDLLPDALAVVRLDAGSALPGWLPDRAFSAIIRTTDELSIVCDAALPPEGLRVERPFRAFRVRGPLPFDVVGVLAALAAPLAAEGLPIFALATFDTDYLLVRAEHLDRALATLARAGHRVAAGSR